MGNPVFAVVNSKFHGGGVLYKSKSLRQIVRWHRRNHDGCFNGAGCESFAVSVDEGETWYPVISVEIEDLRRGELGTILGAPDFFQEFSDMNIGVEVDWNNPIQSADRVFRETMPAL